MTISSSIGYAGTVFDADIAPWLVRVGGSDYGVVGAGDFKVSLKVGADRTVKFASGSAWGQGIVDMNDSSETSATVQVATLTSGTRYDLVGVLRTWDGESSETTFDKVTGTSSQTAAFASRPQTPGDVDFQPLAVVRVNGTAEGGVIADIVDLRVWQANGGATAENVLALQYINGVGTEVRIGTTVYTRMLDETGAATWSTRTVGVTESSLTWATNWTGSNATVKVIDGQTAHLEGRIIRTAATTAVDIGILTTLPVGSRPSAKIVAPVSIAFSTSTAPVAAVGHLIIDTNGQVSLSNPAAANVAVWHVGTICWPVA
jgi:hypothetical protein